MTTLVTDVTMGTFVTKAIIVMVSMVTVVTMGTCVTKAQSCWTEEATHLSKQRRT
jgi:hypothetical protein